MYFSYKKIKTVLLDIFDLIAFFIFVGGIVLSIRFFVANPYTVVGSSMSPTFEQNDFIIVDKITPRLDKRERGDIIVFVPPGKTIPYIKRIIGFPGEIIKIQEGIVSICDQTDQCEPLDEYYLPEGLQTRARCGLDTFPIEGGLFVLGDNRGYSTDSSCCFGLGCYEGANYVVPTDHVIGKVYVRVFPGFTFF